MVEQDLQNLDTGHSRIFLELPVEVLWSFLSKKDQAKVSLNGSVSAR